LVRVGACPLYPWLRLVLPFLKDLTLLNCSSSLDTHQEKERSEVSKKDADLLVRDLNRYFTDTGSRYRVVMRGSHWHVVTPSGASVGSFAGTPSDSHFRGNAISQLRRRGIIPRDWR
jgi:hypothetical protein